MEELTPATETPKTFNFARTSLALAIIGVVIPILVTLIAGQLFSRGILTTHQQELMNYTAGILMLLSFISVITADIVGIIALVKGKPGKGLAIAGIIISSAGAPLIFISLILVIIYIIRIF
jgi:hypothetical protein